VLLHVPLHPAERLRDGDRDGDGAADCIDECPDDPNKTEEGMCKCGNPETDDDADGICDFKDFCFGFPNVDCDEDGLCDEGGIALARALAGMM
jgi:hypothetical protein